MQAITLRAGVPWHMSAPRFQLAVHRARDAIRMLGATVHTVDAAPTGRNNFGKIIFELEMNPGSETPEMFAIAVKAAVTALKRFKIEATVE